MWAREWPPHGVVRALVVLTVFVAGQFLTLPPFLNVLLWVWVVVMLVGFAVVLRARRGIYLAQKDAAVAPPHEGGAVYRGSGVQE